MEPVRVMIAEDNPLQRDTLVDSLSKQRGVSVIGAACNGLEAIKLIEEKRPQVLVCDMVMPQLDGFGVLEKIARMEPTKRPSVIALTALSRDDFITRAINLGVAYYMVKPVNIASLVHQIMELVGATDVYETVPAKQARLPVMQTSKENYVSGVLLRIGVPPHINGYKYIREAVIIAMEHPEVLDRITKKLYPAVAERFQTTPSRVERSIRHAISLTWERGGAAAFEKIMERSNYSDQDKPTNCEFIAMLSERIRFWLLNTGLK